MPKAPRDQESTTPKKRVRKTAPKSSNGNGNGVHVEAENGNGALAKTPEIPSETQATPSVEEQIRARAYELYVQRGGNGGSPEHDWLRAKEEICGR
jgi:hypothetical protein